ncbi:MAG TPA: aminodeoxychorismate synthase component I, partial [Woeseiaceae bacterium]|nr:aminodeoxychorismate synthase component I [Woeseiaceae bacterium]
YEAAAGFDTACVTRPAGKLPLACFGLFRQPRLTAHPGDGETAATAPWRMSISRHDYAAGIAAIREQIAEGNTYQINYTVRQRASDVADPWALFLGVASDAPYAAYIDGGDHVIVSASPELFFEMDGDAIACRPMKGTAPRGLTLEEDLALRERLRASPKDRAENVMITDMVRNDLGRIAEAGSVRAAALCEVEKYRTVWQITSTVQATSNASVARVFKALFPCASVTGAPKVASMKLIAALEDSPREIYTGAIGFMAPGRKARFNVAIRTAWIDRATNTATYGVGGGIVWDSDADAEYHECLDKARILSARAPRRDFELLETLLWRPEEGWVLRDAHLARMADSAAYFDFTFDRARLIAGLDELPARLLLEPCRARILLARDGAVRFEAAVLPSGDTAAPFRLRLAPHPVDRRNPFLYHKTTERSVYDEARAAAGDCDDVLLWNEAREITESTIANFVVRRRGRLVTPPVECGLLRGTLRQELLEEGRIHEERITLDALQDADEIWLVNSVRGWIPCRLESFTGGRSTAAG